MPRSQDWGILLLTGTGPLAIVEIPERTQAGIYREGPQRMPTQTALPSTVAATKLPLRDYQTEVLEKVAAAEARGVKRQLVSLPTGSGKTVVAAHLIAQRGWRTVFIVHRDELVKQSVAKINEVDPSNYPGVVKAERREMHSQTIIASAQTLAVQSRLDALVAATRGQKLLVISDECFPAGTLIDGRPIETIREGDVVTAFNEATGRMELRRVVRTFVRTAKQLCTIMVGPEQATCTPNHPFWTRQGWVAAGALLPNDEVLRYDPSLQDVWRALPAESSAPGAEDYVLNGVPQRGQRLAHGGDQQAVRGGSDAHEQSHASGRQPGANEGDPQEDGAPPPGAWRKRHGTDSAAGAIASGARRWVGGGISDPDNGREVFGERASAGLQIGHRPPRPAHGDRGGRRVARRATSASYGSPETGMARWARVDSVEVHEPTGDGGFGSLCANGLVYNFEVEGLHTYTANGFVVHNCHHDRAPSRTRAIQALAPDLLIGLTATPSRGDKLGLDAIYEEIVAHVSMLHLIARGILSPIKGIRIETDTNLDDVHTRAGEFAENELADAVDSPERNKLIYRSWAKHAVGRKRTVVFAVNVAHAIALRDTFRANGVISETILGETPSDERARILADFSAGKIPVLTNCMVLTEGYDEPLIDCELLARPTKSPGLYTQMVGRAARKAEGKTDALIIDFVDVTARHKLITLPTLAGVDEDPAGSRIPEAGEEDREAGEEMDLLNYAQQRSAARKTRSVEVDLFAASQYIWQSVDGHHMAPDGGGTWLTLIPKGVGYLPARIFQSNTRGGSPRVELLFDRPVEAETAMALAEATTSVNRLNSKEADWRLKETPASDKQIAFARVLKINVPHRATKGQVSSLIDEAMFRREIKKVRL